MYAESGKQEPNEYKNKKRAKRSEEKNNTHQLKMKIVLFIAVRLTMATTTTHVRTWCCCCLPLFSTNPFVIHAILPIHSSFFLIFFSLDRARSRLPFTSYFVFIYLVLSSLLHVFDDVLCVLFQFYLLGGVAGLSCMHNNNFNFIDIKWSLLLFLCVTYEM